MKNIKLETLNLKKLTLKKKLVIYGGKSSILPSQTDDVNTTTGDSYSDDNSTSADSAKRDSQH